MEAVAVAQSTPAKENENCQVLSCLTLVYLWFIFVVVDVLLVRNVILSLYFAIEKVIRLLARMFYYLCAYICARVRVTVFMFVCSDLCVLWMDV